jgi:hypothetical protein
MIRHFGHVSSLRFVSHLLTGTLPTAGITSAGLGRFPDQPAPNG